MSQALHSTSASPCSDPLALSGWLFLSSFGIGQSWLIALDASAHGGFFFLLPLTLFSLLLVWPLFQTELAMGRRAGRALPEGMSKLTREADAPRFYRAWSWGSLVALALTMGMALLAAALGLEHLLHALTATNIHSRPESASLQGWLGISLLLCSTGAYFLHDQAWLQQRPFILVATLLLLLGLVTLGVDSGIHQPHWASMHGGYGWAALRDALLLQATGYGLWFSIGHRMTTSVPIARITLTPLLISLCSVALMIPVTSMATDTIFHPISIDSLNSIGLELNYLGMFPSALFHGILFVGGILALVGLAEPLYISLAEQGLSLRLARLAVHILAIFMAIALLIPVVLTLRTGLILALVLVLSIFAGWTMKISHLRKSLQLSNELFYNLLRISIRILLPLALIGFGIGSLF